MEYLTKEIFKKKVFDFEKNQDWKFEGDIPALVDFYAEWCAPCRMLSPILEEIADEYNGKINVYKVDTEYEQELSTVFGIRSIPTLLFCPKNEKPRMVSGLLSKQDLKDVIEEVLLEMHNA